MGTIIIKLYTNSKLAEYSDLCITRFETLLKEMKEFAKKNGSVIYFSVLTSEGFPASSDCFAEVEYTGELQNEEKKYYLEVLNELATDAEISGGEMGIFNTLRFVRFNQITDEIITL